MNRVLVKLKHVCELVFVYLTLVFLFSSFWRDVILASLPFRIHHLLLTILVVLALYEILESFRPNW